MCHFNLVVEELLHLDCKSIEIKASRLASPYLLTYRLGRSDIDNHVAIGATANDKRIKEDSDETRSKVFLCTKLVDTRRSTCNVLTLNQLLVQDCNLVLRAITVSNNRKNASCRHNGRNLNAFNNFRVVNLNLIALIHLLLIQFLNIERVHVDGRRRSIVLSVVHKRSDICHDALNETSVLGDIPLIRNLRQQRAIFCRGGIHQARSSTSPDSLILCIEHVCDNLIEVVCLEVTERRTLLVVYFTVKLRKRDTVNKTLDISGMLLDVNLCVECMVNLTGVNKCVLTVMRYALKIASRMTCSRFCTYTLK
nr:MAG TPA: hypothetical protein [Caudoviricetes sp.]